jgi:hypothetical protein
MCWWARDKNAKAIYYIATEIPPASDRESVSQLAWYQHTESVYEIGLLFQQLV